MAKLPRSSLGVVDVERDKLVVSIMIVDDHALMRRIVREVVEKEGDLEVVAEARNGLEAETQAAQKQPEVVLMDLDMPDCDGFEGTERVLANSPHSNVVIFSASHQERHLFQALQRGATGYVTKDVEPDGLIHAIRCAARKELCLPSSFAASLVAKLRTLEQFQESGSSASMYSGAQEDGIDREHNIQRITSIAYKIPRHSTAHGAYTTSETNELQSLEQEATNSARPLTDREQEILDLMRKGHKNREIAEVLCIAESTVHKHVQNIFEKLHARNRTEAIYLTSAGSR